MVLTLKGILLIAAASSFLVSIKNVADWKIYLKRQRSVVDPSNSTRTLQLIKQNDGTLKIKGEKYNNS